MVAERRHHGGNRKTMATSKPRSFALTVVLAASLLTRASSADGPLPSLDAPDLAQGPYASGHMLLQKTILRIDVATIDVRFDRAAQARMAELARGKPYSDALERQLAPI